jgi:hypothetical protein
MEKGGKIRARAKSTNTRKTDDHGDEKPVKKYNLRRSSYEDRFDLYHEPEFPKAALKTKKFIKPVFAKTNKTPSVEIKVKSEPEQDQAVTMTSIHAMKPSAIPKQQFQVPASKIIAGSSSSAAKANPQQKCSMDVASKMIHHVPFLPNLPQSTPRVFRSEPTAQPVKSPEVVDSSLNPASSSTLMKIRIDQLNSQDVHSLIETVEKKDLEILKLKTENDRKDREMEKVIKENILLRSRFSEFIERLRVGRGFEKTFGQISDSVIDRIRAGVNEVLQQASGEENE